MRTSSLFKAFLKYLKFLWFSLHLSLSTILKCLRLSLSTILKVLATHRCLSNNSLEHFTRVQAQKFLLTSTFMTHKTFEYHSCLLLQLVDIQVPYLMRNQAQKYYFQNFTKMIFKPTLVSHKATWETAKRCLLPQNRYYIFMFLPQQVWPLESRSQVFLAVNKKA